MGTQKAMRDTCECAVNKEAEARKNCKELKERVGGLKWP